MNAVLRKPAYCYVPFVYFYYYFILLILKHQEDDLNENGIS